MMDKIQTIDFYNVLYKGSKMGQASIDQILKKCESKCLKRDLLDLQNTYKRISHEADQRLQRLGEIPMDIPIRGRVMLWGMVQMGSSSESRLSHMVLNGINMGAQEICEGLVRYQKAAPSAKKLARKMLQIQEDFSPVFGSYLN